MVQEARQAAIDDAFATIEAFDAKCKEL